MACERQIDGGYALTELLVAATLVLLLSALTCSVLADAKTMMEVGGERADTQQRTRVGIDAIVSSIRDAGAGSDRGDRAGPLVQWAPAVWPGRGNRVPDTTSITTLRVLSSPPPAMLAHDVAPGATSLAFERAGCALPCGFFDRMMVIVLDGRGDFDLFVLVETDGASADVRRLPGGTGASYPRGAAVLPVDVRTFYWNSAASELRAQDDDRADFPIVNDVVDVSFEYFGDPSPPQQPRPPAGEENCLYDAGGNLRASLQTLPPGGGTMAPLNVALFEDGPWCGAGSEPFDADLLRIRGIRVALRAQASDSAYRGIDAQWFRRPGTGTRSARFVKDVTLQTTVTPRNLGLWR